MALFLPKIYFLQVLILLFLVANLPLESFNNGVSGSYLALEEGVFIFKPGLGYLIRVLRPLNLFY